MSSHHDTDAAAERQLRDRAERLWQSHHDDLTARTPAEVLHLVEELQIHQIELQLQNEELVETQRNLEGSRQELRDLYDFAPVGYLTLDVNGVIVRANLTLATMLGRERRRLIGRHFHQYVNRMSPLGLYEALRGEPASWNGELVLCRSDDTLFPVAVEMTRMGGDVVLWRCAVTDITTRKAAEQVLLETAELRASEDRYRGLAEQVVDGIFVADAQGRYVDANRAACELLGYTLGQLKILSVTDVLAPEELSRLPDQFRRLQRGEIVRNEWRFKRKDRSLFLGELVGRQLPDGRLQAVVRDITERKEAEEIQRRFHQLAMLPLKNNLGEMLGAIVETAILTAHADFGNIQLLSLDSSSLHIAAHRGFPQWWIDYWQDVSHGRGVCGTAFKTGERVIVEDVTQSPIFAGADLEMQLKAGVRAVLSTPLASRLGKLIGMLSVHFTKPHRPDDRTLQMLDLLAREAADVIGHVRTEMELKGQAELLDLAHDCILVRDSGGHITYWNDSAAEIYGWSRAEALGKVSNALLQTQFSERLEDIVQIVLKSGHWEGELVQTCRDGRRIVVDSRWTMQHDDVGDGFRILEINKDITARKQVEQALRESEHMLRDSEEQLRLAMEGARAGLWSWDLRTKQVVWDRRVSELMGLPVSERPSFDAFLSCVPEAERAHLVARLERMMHTPGDDAWREEFPFVRSDGTTVWIAGFGRMERDADGRAVRFIGMDLDITERKQRDQERAEEARRKDEFLAFLGHELRNPLAAVDLAIQVLSRGASPPQRARMQDIIHRQTVLMRRLVDDLLELERISHGHIELKLEPLDLADCLRRSSAAIRSTVASRHQDLGLRLPTGSVSFVADSARVDQIVGNLLTNASNYTSPGGRIEVSGAREGSDVIIRCKDNGQGILPEDQLRIFEPFARGRKTELGFGEASVGLGLALVKQLTELHGGTVSVDSPGAGLGSEFVVRLPATGISSDQSVADQPNVVPPPQQHRSIVIVEDNPSVAAALQAALEQAGHTARVFVDGPSAMAGISELQPDALVLDIGLPGMDGYELAGKLKTLENTKHALYIAVSGHKVRDGVRHGADGFDHYFTKPIDMAALLAALNQP